MAKNAPPPKISELRAWSAHLELAIENRLDLAGEQPHEMTPSDAVALVLSAIVEARKEMGW